MDIIFESNKGKVIEDVENSEIIVHRKGMRDFDGIRDSYTYTATINYSTGLYTSESCTGYFAKYYDMCKDRDKAIETAIREIR